MKKGNYTTGVEEFIILLQRLQTRLDGLGQSGRTRLSDLKLPSSPKTAKSLFTSSTAHNATALDHGGNHHDHGGHDHDDSAPDHDGLLLHSDTIILVSSMVVMIILGKKSRSCLDEISRFNLTFVCFRLGTVPDHGLLHK